MPCASYVNCPLLATEQSFSCTSWLRVSFWWICRTACILKRDDYSLRWDPQYFIRWIPVVICFAIRTACVPSSGREKFSQAIKPKKLGSIENCCCKHTHTVHSKQLHSECLESKRIPLISPFLLLLFILKTAHIDMLSG